MPAKLYINFILILFVLLACQGEDLIDDRVDPKIRVLDRFESIQLGEPGKTISLAYFNIVGNRIDSPDFKWESSDTSVLAVSSDGIINAVGVGEATITVSIQTFEGKTLTQTFDIKVNVEPNLEITTDVPSSILKGNQLDIEFSFVDSNTGKELQPESIEWTSQDDKIIDVDENGKITGVEIGRTTIVLSITFDGDTKEQEIELGVIVTPELKIESSDTAIIQNQTLTLNSVFNGSDGQPKDGVEISYTSSNTDIITVDINGKVTAIRKGVAEITGKVIFEGMVYEDKISFNVNLEPKITLTETVNAITEGNSLKFNATFFDENGEENTDVTFTWKTANTESLKVEQNGTITAIQAKDSAIITVTVQYNGETYTEEFAIEIKAKPIEPILEITQKPNTLEHDAEYKVEFTFTNQLDDQAIQPDEPAEWKSDDIGVVSVDDNGNLSAQGEGSTIITVSIVYNGQTFEDSFSVRVMAENQTIPVDPVLTVFSSLTDLEVDQESTISFRFFNKVNDQTIEHDTFNWSSSDPDIISLEGNGKIVAQKEGSATIQITVNYLGQSYTQSVEIKVSAPSTEIEIEPQINLNSFPSSLEEDQESQASFEFVNKTNNQALQPESIAWSSSDTDVATIDTNGNVVAKSEGSTTITITIVYNSETFTDSFSFDVTTITQVIVQPEVTFRSTINSLEEEEESTVNYQFINTNNNQALQPESIDWRSSDTDVATIDDDGNIVAKNEGSTTITITIAYGGESFTDTFSLRVTAKPPLVVVQPAVSFSANINSLEEEEESTVTYRFIDTNNNQALQPESITWNSSDTDVATIDNNGNVVAKSEGSTNITITIVYNGQSFSDTFPLKITAKPNVVEPELSLTSPPSSLKKGNESQLNYSFIDKTNNQALNPQSIQWESENENVVSVNNSGLLTGIDLGTTTITLTTNYDGQPYTDSFSIRVWIDPVISITSTLQRIEKDDTETLSFDYFDDQGQKQSLQTPRWTSSDTGIISVDSNGVITAKKVGRATVRVRTQVGSSIYDDTITIDVYVEPQLSISNPTNSITEGTSYDFNFDFTGEDGQSATPDSVKWNSSDTDVLTIDDDGVVTTVSTGTSTITVTVNYQNQSYSENFNFTVNADPNKNQSTESFSGSISGSYGLKGSYEVRADGDDLLIELKDDFSINNSLPDGALYLTNASGRITGTVKQIWRGRSHYNGPRTYRVENTGLKEFQYIVIWCVNFHVHVGTAKLFDD